MPNSAQINQEVKHNTQMKTPEKINLSFVLPIHTARWPLVASAFVAGLLPLTVLAAPINGTITGKTASGTIGDDVLTSTTIDIGYFTSCYFITDSIGPGGFGDYNFVFAGQGVASAIPNIDPSDFTVSQYNPWIGNNNATMNNVIAPSGTNYNRGLTDKENGGANIVISYTPQNAGDPTNINFLQAFVLSLNNGSTKLTAMDNGGKGGPFYNENGAAGTGMTEGNGAIPLVTSKTTPGWLLDIPNIPEYGYLNEGDDTITNASDIFQTFISSQVNISGTNYNVLYGGIQWGFTFGTMDVPEPSTLVLSGTAILGLVAYARRRKA